MLPVFIGYEKRLNDKIRSSEYDLVKEYKTKYGLKTRCNIFWDAYPNNGKQILANGFYRENDFGMKRLI